MSAPPMPAAPPQFAAPAAPQFAAPVPPQMPAPAPPAAPVVKETSTNPILLAITALASFLLGVLVTYLLMRR
jgi:hypothetical protein